MKFKRNNKKVKNSKTPKMMTIRDSMGKERALWKKAIYIIQTTMDNNLDQVMEIYGNCWEHCTTGKVLWNIKQ